MKHLKVIISLLILPFAACRYNLNCSELKTPCKQNEAHFHLIRAYDQRLEQQPRDLVIDRYSKDWYALKRYIDKSSKIHRIECPPNAIDAPTLCNVLYILDWGENSILIDKDYRILIGHVNEKNEQLFIRELKRIIITSALKYINHPA